MPPSDHPDDRQAENPYRAPAAEPAIATPKWREVIARLKHTRPVIAILYNFAALLGLLALAMTYAAATLLIEESMLVSTRSSLAVLVGAIVIPASVAILLVWIARRINR